GGNIDGGGGAGINTLDYSAYTTGGGAGGNVTANLTTGTGATAVGGTVSNIQNATGGGGDDVLVGDGNNNTLTGNAGTNQITDNAGNDTLNGGVNSDTFFLIPGSADVFNDSCGDDTVDFSRATAGITIDMDLGTVQTVSGSDTVQLVGTIENFVGSGFSDTVAVIAPAGATNRSMDGGIGGGVLTVDAGGQTASYNGTTITFGGSGTITATNWTTVNITGASGNVALVLTGTPGVDNVDIDAIDGDSITVNGVTYNGVNSLQFNAGGGNDVFDVDVSAGVLLAGGITVSGQGDGGAPGDSLSISGAGQGQVTYNYTNANDGSIVMTGRGTINYTGLEPIANTGTPTNIIFNLPDTADPNVSLSDVAGVGRLATTTPSFEATNFAYPAANGSIEINMGGNAQTLTITSLALNANTSVDIDGEGGTDVINLNATGGLTITGTLTLAAETLAQTGGVAVTGLTTLSNQNAATALTLAHANNNFSTLTVTAPIAAVTINDADGIVLGNISGNSLGVTAGGTITDTGTANTTVTNNASFDSITDDVITLDDTYSFGSLTFDGGAVTVLEANAMVLSGASNATTLDLDTTAGSITDDNVLANFFVTGNANFNTGDDAAITLTGLTYRFGSLTVDGGGVLIFEDDATLLTGTNDATDFLSIVSGASIADDPGVSLTVANNASFADAGGAGITLGDNGGDTINFGTLTVVSTGAVAVTEDSNMVFSGTNTAGSLTVTSEGTGVGAGDITDGTDADIAVTGLATFIGGTEAADVIRIGDSAGNVAEFGSLTFTLPLGAVTISERGTTPGTLLTGTSTAATLDLDSTGAITDNAGTTLTVTDLADIAGTSITLGDDLTDAIDFGSLTTDTSSGVGTQQITETNGIDGLSLDADSGNITLISGGPLTDADILNDVTAADFIVQAVGGIGVTGARIATTVARMDVRNLTGGAIFITNSGALQLIELGGNSVLAVDGVGGGGEIAASSPLTISSNSTTTGGFTYTATDSGGGGDDLTVNSAATVQDDTSLTLNAGDDLNINAGTTVTALTGILVLNLDAGDNDGGGETANIFGNIAGDTSITLNDSSDGNTVVIDSNGALAGGTVDNVQNNLVINSGGGSDTLNLTDTGDASADTAVNISNDNVAGGDGTITGLVDAGSSIEFNSVEAANFNFSNIGGSGNGDTVTIAPNATTVYFLDGNDPTAATGDTLRLDVTGIADAQLELTPTETRGFVGTLSGTGIANVNFVEFETFDVTGGLVDVVVRIDQSDDAFLTAAPFGLVAGEGFEDDGPVAEDTDTTRVEIDGGGNFQVSVNNTVNTATFDIAPAIVRSLRIEGSSDNDILVISDAGGLPVVQGNIPATAPGFADNAFVTGTPGILFNAGTGNDEVRYELDLANGSADVINQTYGVGNGAGAGNTPVNLTGEIRTENATA
ncbi:MAG: hypothetical protein O3A00_23455, partial [Planctomycetota bacterium]|nr:hypothetical protein [Planctomycetota bacterium]